MSWNTDTSWTSPRSTRAARVGKRLVLLAVVVICAYGAFEAAHSPKLRKYMPKMALKSIANAQEAYVKYLGKDLVVESSTIQAKKVLNVDLRRSRFGMIQEKTFRISANLVAAVKVESISDSRTAKKVFRARGGSDIDQLELGVPSFVESHGLNDQYNYFIRAVSYHNDRIVTVTVERQLTKQEQNVAMGSQYESIMGEMAALYLDRVTGISKKQVVKLAALK